MPKFHFLLFVAIMFCIFMIIAKWMTGAEKKRDNRLRATYRKFHEARNKRLRWLERYGHIIPNPKNHPDYEELWLVEIGAEALIRIQCSDTNTNETSFKEYVLEKRTLVN